MASKVKWAPEHWCEHQAAKFPQGAGDQTNADLLKEAGAGGGVDPRDTKRKSSSHV